MYSSHSKTSAPGSIRCKGLASCEGEVAGTIRTSEGTDSLRYPLEKASVPVILF